jgi:hypothetical protein
MVLLDWFLLLICLPFFPNRSQRRLMQLTFFCHSSTLALKLRLSMRDNYTKAFCLTPWRMPICLATDLTSIRRTSAGVSTSPIYLQFGLCQRDTSPWPSVVIFHVAALAISFRALKTFNRNACVHFLLLWIPHTLIIAFGWTVSKKKSQAYNLRTHTSTLVLPSMLPSKQMGPLVLSFDVCPYK